MFYSSHVASINIVFHLYPFFLFKNLFQNTTILVLTSRLRNVEQELSEVTSRLKVINQEVSLIFLHHGSATEMRKSLRKFFKGLLRKRLETFAQIVYVK